MMYKKPLTRQSVAALTIMIVIAAAASLDPCRSSTVADAKTSNCSAALVAGRWAGVKNGRHVSFMQDRLNRWPLEPTQSFAVPDGWART